MENLNNQTTSEFSDEIELKLLFKGIWLSRYFIILLSFIGATFSVFYAISIPDTYKSEATVLVETNDSDATGMSQYSGLASMAGISLGGSSTNRKDEILHTMISRKFINEFVKNRDILIPLFAFEALGLNKETYTIDNEIFNKTKNSWVDGAFKTKDGNPSQQDIFNTFTDHLKIEEDFSTGFITISIIHESPVLSDQWLKWFIEDVNMHVKSYDMNQSEKALNYLEEKLLDSNIPDINKVLISMTQEEIRKMMLINIREEYILRTIDPSILPLKKIAPSRASLCITITATSFILSILLVTILSFFRRSIMVRFMPPRLAINIF